MARIKKAQVIFGNKINLRNANESDSEFVLKLRLNPKLSKYLNPTSPHLKDQLHYFSRYKNDTSSAYFIIEDKNNNKIGTVRIYNQISSSFEAGSWIMDEGVPIFFSFESALIVYIYALDYLNFEKAHFEVRKENRSVWKFHLMCGAKIVDEDELSYYFSLSNESLKKFIYKHRNYLPNGIDVQF